MRVDPENGKSILLSVLSVGLYSNKVIHVYACASRKRKIYSTFYAFSRPLQQQSYTRLCTCIQETENLLYFLCFQ